LKILFNNKNLNLNQPKIFLQGIQIWLLLHLLGFFSPLVVDCGPVDVVLGEVVFESSGNSTVFGSRIQYSCRDSVKFNSEYLTFSHWCIKVKSY